jgi:hypothetical protein
MYLPSHWPKHCFGRNRRPIILCMPDLGSRVPLIPFRDLSLSFNCGCYRRNTLCKRLPLDLRLTFNKFNQWWSRWAPRDTPIHTKIVRQICVRFRRLWRPHIGTCTFIFCGNPSFSNQLTDNILWSKTIGLLLQAGQFYLGQTLKRIILCPLEQRTVHNRCRWHVAYYAARLLNCYKDVSPTAINAVLTLQL